MGQFSFWLFCVSAVSMMDLEKGGETFFVWSAPGFWLGL
jgi:hypothetical protein